MAISVFKPKEEPIIQTGNYSAILLRPEMDLNLKNGTAFLFYDQLSEFLMLVVFVSVRQKISVWESIII